MQLVRRQRLRRLGRVIPVLPLPTAGGKGGHDARRRAAESQRDREEGEGGAQGEAERRAEEVEGAGSRSALYEVERGECGGCKTVVEGVVIPGEWSINDGWDMCNG